MQNRSTNIKLVNSFLLEQLKGKKEFEILRKHIPDDISLIYLSLECFWNTGEILVLRTLLQINSAQCFNIHVGNLILFLSQQFAFYTTQ